MSGKPIWEQISEIASEFPPAECSKGDHPADDFTNRYGSTLVKMTQNAAFKWGYDKGKADGIAESIERGNKRGFARGIRFTVITTAVIGFLLWLACRLSSCSEIVLFGG